MGNQTFGIRKQTHHPGIDCLTWWGALLKHIETLVELHTGMPARIGEPVEHLAHGYTKDLSSPIYATAIGLLKYTIDNLPDKVYVEYSNQEMAQAEVLTKTTPEIQNNSNDDFDDEGSRRSGRKGKCRV